VFRDGVEGDDHSVLDPDVLGSRIAEEDVVFYPIVGVLRYLDEADIPEAFHDVTE